MSLLISLIICFTEFFIPVKELKIYAKPGETYYLPSEIRNTRVIVLGSGSKSSPFHIKGIQDYSNFSENSSITIVGNNITISQLKFINDDIQIKYEALIKVGTINNYSENVKIDDCKFLYTKRFIDKDLETSYFWIRFSANNSKITNCEFNGKRNRMPIVHIEGKSFGNEISKCIFKNVPKRINDLEALEAIRVGLGEGRAEVKIFSNKFINYFGDSETISIKSDGVIIDNNYFENCRSGISLRLSNHSIISNNTFKNTFWPVRINGSGHILKNNFFDKTCENSIVFIKENKNYYPTKNITIENNIFEKKLHFVLLEPIGSFGFPQEIRLLNNKIKGSVFRKGENKIIGKDFFQNPHSKKTRSDGISESMFHY